ncbi:flagellar basal body L-ring protein FlgH [Pinirhizobacter sp.]|jgi:flagellar L-ring protein precursor FlgH|uniref:flagellar basal body L-ring protein FlgH n=1 Tax=Pinirhizobacter sp. TaxID=2950432 RepID=UPI002F3E81C2
MSRADAFMAGLLLLTASPSAAAMQPGGGMIDPTSYHGLAEDRRAHRIGDTLTVVVVETSRASAAANTASGNDVAFNAGLRTQSRNHSGALSLGASDTGTGQTTRSGAVQTQLAVRVVGLDDNGTLHIHGEQSVVVNGETQHIALNGAVRPEDISSANTILSNRISEARIEFTGRGDVSEPQRRSIIYRFTKWLGLI